MGARDAHGSSRQPTTAADLPVMPNSRRRRPAVLAGGTPKVDKWPGVYFLTCDAPVRSVELRPLVPRGRVAITCNRLYVAALRSAYPHHSYATHLLEQGLSLEGDRRSPGAPIFRDDSDLRQGRSGWPAARGRGFRAGGLAMNIEELVTHYIAFRRTLGEKCKTNESILRSFCRAVGTKTSIADVGADVVVAFLNGNFARSPVRGSKSFRR